MNSKPLNRPYVGISLSTDDYAKVKGLLPTPSYKDTLHSRTTQKIILVYVIEGYITSYKQFKWLSDIKLALKDYLIVEYEEVEEFYISDSSDGDGVVYSLNELHKTFKAEYKRYPNVFYAPNKKGLYRHLLLHGKKLRHSQLFTMEAMTSAALMMNKKLKDKFSIKELHKKVKGAYKYILENEENFRERLSKHELKEAHKRGAEIANQKRSFNSESKIFEALATGKYIKANGEINKTLLADDLRMNRKTIAKYIKSIAI